MALPKNIEHPTFSVTIPSTKAKIKIRPMLVKDEKILMIAKTGAEDENTEVLSAIKQVVQNCIASPGIDCNLLAIFDIEYLFLKIRAISTSNVIKLEYIDSEDNEKYSVEVDLNKVEIKFPENVSSLIKIGKDSAIQMQYPEAALFNEKGFLDMDENQAFNEICIRCMQKYIQGDSVTLIKNETKESVQEFFDNLDIKTFEKIQEFIRTMPRLYHVAEYTNSKGTKREIVFASLYDFFTF